LVSVLLPVYNGEKYVSIAIESILNQSFANFELTAINDASTDDSLRIIEGHNDPRIQTVDFAKNRGLVQSLNYGINEAKGEYIARQDADDVSLPTGSSLSYAFLMPTRGQRCSGRAPVASTNMARW